VFFGGAPASLARNSTGERFLKKMKNFLKENWFKILIAIIFVAIVGGIFYWYQNGFKLPTVVDNPKEMAIVKGELTNEEISEISKSILWLSCSTLSQDGEIYELLYGSGTYIHRSLIDGKKSRDNFNYSDGYILTNAHVAVLKTTTEETNRNLCRAGKQGESILPSLKIDANPYFGFFVYDKNTDFLDDNKDIALLKKQRSPNEEDIIKLKESLLKNYPPCPKEKIIGSNIYIFGYPATGEEEQKKSNTDIFIPIPPNRNLIVSTGIISGIDSHENYYTDAKIDSGSSGGLAVSKINGEICIVGIPTWASIGNIETLGMIQSFWKVQDVLKIMEL